MLDSIWAAPGGAAAGPCCIAEITTFSGFTVQTCLRAASLGIAYMANLGESDEMVLFYGGWLSQFYPVNFKDYASGQVVVVHTEMRCDSSCNESESPGIQLL